MSLLWNWWFGLHLLGSQKYRCELLKKAEAGKV